MSVDSDSDSDSASVVSDSGQESDREVIPQAIEAKKGCILEHRTERAIYINKCRYPGGGPVCLRHNIFLY